MENTVISNVSPEDISKLFDSVGVSSEQIITGEPRGEAAEAKESTDPKPFTAAASTDIADFDNFVKLVEGDEPQDEIVDLFQKEPTPVAEVKEPAPKKADFDFDTAAQELIKDGLLDAFEDGEPIKSKKDFKELIAGNIQAAKEQAKEEGALEALQALPREVHLAAEYVMKGGKDVKAFFKAMAAMEEVRELSLDNEAGQEDIVRMHLEHQGFTEEEIDSEIFDLKDSGRLESKAKMYKPKLDKVLEKDVQAKIKEQEELQERREEGERIYKSSVYEALKEGEINGVKVDKKVQSFLFNGLTNNQFKSITGGSTNLLGALLEKIQFVEPDYKLLAEATWLLADPEGYKKELKKEVKETVTADTVRKIKAASEGSKTGLPDTTPEPEQARPKIKRGGFFKSL